MPPICCTTDGVPVAGRIRPATGIVPTSNDNARNPNVNSLLPVPAMPRRLAAWAPIPLRLIVGGGFMEHGFAKLGRGADAFAAILQAIGVPFPHLMSWATIAVEVSGGLAILLGACVALASVPMAAVLLVAIFTVHLPYGFSSIKLMAVTPAGAHFGQPGYECDLLYLAGLAALVLGGAGPWALDNLWRRRRGRSATGAALA
jgi:putative oxidoreductase